LYCENHRAEKAQTRDLELPQREIAEATRPQPFRDKPLEVPATLAPASAADDVEPASPEMPELALLRPVEPPTVVLRHHLARGHADVRQGDVVAKPARPRPVVGRVW
jgi:hypothetical protein